MGLFLTSHLSKLPRVRNQGLNHSHCDWASSSGCENIMTSPVWLHDRSCLSSPHTQKDGLALQLDRKAKRIQPGATPHCSTWVLRFTKSPEVCAGWKNLQNLNYQGGWGGVTSAQNSEKPHHCGAQNHQVKILPERQTTTHMGFLPTTCQAYMKLGEIWKSFTPTNSECRLPW